MAQRRQASDVVGLVARLTGFVVLISLFFPAARRAFAALGFIGVSLSILIIAGLVGFDVYRLATRYGRMKAMTENPFAAPADASDQTWNEEKSEVIPDLLYPVLRRRYPWRH